jgi:hypothetical protein
MMASKPSKKVLEQQKKAAAAVAERFLNQVKQQVSL